MKNKNFQQHNNTTHLIDMLKFTLLSLIVWGLAIQISYAQGGQTCSEATVAEQGINFAQNSLGDQWFSYTATTNGKVTISSCGQTSADTYVEIFDGCGLESFTASNDYCEKQSEVSFEVANNTTYWICWRENYTSQDFEWFLTQAETEQGEFCSNAISVDLGSHQTNITSNDYKWFQFTASREGKVKIESIGSNAGECKIAVFDDCSHTLSLNSDGSWNPCKTAIEGESGKTYLIALLNSGETQDISWSITEEDWIPGERCTEPIDVLSVEEATINHDSGTDKWYRFIASKDEEITITSVGVTGEDTYVEVYEGCGTERIAFNDDAEGLQSEIKLNVKEGKAYYIKWDNIFEPNEYVWSLKASSITTDTPDLENSGIAVYPTKSSGPVTFDLTGFDSESVNVTVYSASGALISSSEFKGGIKHRSDLSSLSKGMYQIVINDLVSKRTFKFLKQ